MSFTRAAAGEARRPEMLRLVLGFWAWVLGLGVGPGSQAWETIQGWEGEALLDNVGGPGPSRSRRSSRVGMWWGVGPSLVNSGGPPPPDFLLDPDS